MKKIIWRKCFYFVIFLCLPAFFLQLLMTHGPSPKNSEHLLKAVGEECAKHFRNPLVLKKLSRVVAKGDADEFMSIMQNLLPSCQLKITDFYTHNGYGLIDPVLASMLPYNMSSYNFTNVTTMEIIKNLSTPITSLCPRQSPYLRGHIDLDLADQPQLRRINGQYMNWPMTFEELAATYPNLQVGGYYPGPKNCRCRGYNAVIVPYRNREEHLRYFLFYIHQLLQRQQLCYVVIVSEQDDDEIFNKGQLMNTAFNYARNLLSFDCYIFHDVDVLAEDDRILYTCREDKIMHLAPFIDKFDYKFVNGLTVGAAVGFTDEQFVAVNGYSNEYAGWGGEDDDMAERIKVKKIPVFRSDAKYSRFKMIKHGKDEGNTVNELRYQRLKHTSSRQVFEGLSGLDTILVDNVLFKTHTRLKVKTYKTGMQRDLQKEATKAKEKKEARLRERNRSKGPVLAKTKEGITGKPGGNPKKR